MAEGELRVRVRAATRADVPRVQLMIHELAEYEGEPDGPRLSVHDLLADGFDASPAWFFVLVAELEGGGELAGYALCNRAYSSWTGRALYLEDLFVRPWARRRGVARRLLRRLCRLAAAEGATRLDWHVLQTNAPARAFYERLGARDMLESEGRLALRLPHHRILQLAADADTADADAADAADTAHADTADADEHPL